MDILRSPARARPSSRAHRLVVLGAALALALPGCQSSPAASASPAGASAGVSAEPTAEGAGTPEPGGSPLPAIGGKPTSADLILADVASGHLDAATGLLYRVYAVFGDPRLPAAYLSDTPNEDGAALAEARIEVDSLPVDVAAELRPYLVRPTDPTSVFYDIRATSAARPTIRLASARRVGVAASEAAAPAPVVCNPTSGWGYALGQSNFKVWGECGNPDDDADIQQVTAMVEGFWDAESTFLSREPLADEGKPDPDVWLNDAGGDPRVDVYIINGCQTRNGQCRSLDANTLGTTWTTAPYTTVKGVGVWASYILLPRALLAQTRLFRATVAHELFHVFQNSMMFDGRYNAGVGYHWITESTAKWAEWHFSQVADNVTNWFELYQATDQALYDNTNGNPYSSFTWPLYMEEEAGDPAVIANLWQSLEGQGTFKLVNEALDRTLSFKDHFREFAIRNWNKELGIGDPMDPLHPLPPTNRDQPSGNHTAEEQDLVPRDRGDPYVMTESIPALYATYTPFKVDRDVGQIIVDLSGISSQKNFDADALVKVKDKGWERRKLKKGTTTWCRDNPDDEIEEFVVVLSDHDLAFSNGVGGDWTVESLKEPCLSYDVKITWTDVYDGIADTFTFTGFIDKLEPDLSGSGAVTLSGTGTIEGSRPGWTHCNPGIDTVPSGTGPAILMATIVDDDPTSRAGDTLTIGAFPDLAAADFGVSTEPLTLTRKGGTTSDAGGPDGSDLCPHSWTSTITATLKVKEPLGNAEGN